ncbi:ESF1 homolog [Haliotis asinina]|uniref:ESF1 homolog n=1 Tax=Haliotis asinina TaxID=109174 RepID=UPI003531DCFF
MDDIRKDERFAHIVKDPRFRTMPKNKKKVKIDKRFQSMFTDKKFKLKYSVDKRGRPIQSTTNENLKKYYELSEEDESDSTDDEDGSDGSDEESNIIAKLKKKVETKSKLSDNKQTNLKKTKSFSQSTNSVKKASIKRKKHSAQSSSGEEENQSEEESSEESLKVSKGSKNKGIANGKKTDIVKEESSDDDDDDDDDDEEDESSDSDISVPKVGEEEPDYARGEGLIESSTDEDDDEVEEEDDGFDHKWGELDKGVPEAEELSCRLAICNMDWDRIKAADLFVLLNSFKPANGVISSVRIYPSEFGLQRMKEEEMFGPAELKEHGQEVDVDEEGNEDENEDNLYHREKLRQYQLNRLKYYYAVLECDSVATASKIYDECDGMEYETSSARMDLRYIPDDMTFDQPVKSECLSLPDATSYKPPAFFTSALCQSKVDLTWDETDQDRIKVTMKKMDKKGEINEDDFKAYLASSSEDEEQNYSGLVAHSDESDDVSDEDRQIEKYKNLLKEIDESSNRKGDMEMEIEWEPGLKDTTDDIVKTKKKTKDQTPWEEYQQRKKEKKKQKREEMKKKRLDKKEGKTGEEAFSDDELPAGLADSFFTDALSSGKVESSKKKKKKGKKNLTEEEQEMLKKDQAELSLLMMEEDDGHRHFNLGDLVEKKKKKKKRKKQEEEEDMPQMTGDDFQMDINDSRFGAVFDSHLFNIDPSAPEFKKTKGMEALIEEKLKRRKTDSGSSERTKAKAVPKEQPGDELKPVKDITLTSLVKSVKAKTQQFQTKKKRK